MNNQKYLAGIDIGFSNTGIVILSVPEFKLIFAKTISTEKSNKKRGLRVADDDILRLNVIVNELSKILSIYSGNILLAVELPTGGARGARPNRCMGLATGIIGTIMNIYHYPVHWVAPNEVKKEVVGKNNASKDEIKIQVCRLLSGNYENIIIGKRKEIKYNFLINGESKDFFSGEFEHIADAYGAALFCKNHSDLYKVFVK